MSRSKVIVGLDIGTTKVACVVGEVDQDGIDILGMGAHPHKGILKGVAIDTGSTIGSIRKAVEEARIQSKCAVHSVYVGITGGHVKSMMSHGVSAIRSGVVAEKDIDRVMEAAAAVVIPRDREVIHVLPSEYILDEAIEKEPLNQSGIRLEVNCHVVTALSASIDNLLHCCNEAGLDVDGVVFEPLASAYSVLMPSEKNGGVALLDIGGGTSDLIIMREGSVMYSKVFGLGGNHVTDDIVRALDIPDFHRAEQLKKKYGVASIDLAEERVVELPVMNGNEAVAVPHRILAKIIQRRMESIFRHVNQDLISSGFGIEAERGIVLTGGTCLMPGTELLARRVFGKSVRVGSPAGIGGRIQDIASPIYATAVGLVIHGANQQVHGIERSGPFKGRPRWDDMIQKLKGWFAELL